MDAIRFHATIDSDGVIRPPADVRLSPGEVDVVIVPSSPPPAEIGGQLPAERHLVDELIELADELENPRAPSDLAENHDYYAHGAPKGIDKL